MGHVYSQQVKKQQSVELKCNNFSKIKTTLWATAHFISNIYIIMYVFYCTSHISKNVRMVVGRGTFCIILKLARNIKCKLDIIAEKANTTVIYSTHVCIV